MSRWRKKGTRRGTLLLLLFLALALGGAALCLASFNLLLTTTIWGHSLCQAQIQPNQDLPRQGPKSEPQIFYQNVWEKQQFLYQKLREEKDRHRRSVKRNKERNKGNRKTAQTSAAHYEVRSPKGSLQMNADSNGTIRHWIEVPLNSSSPVQYDDKRGEFTVSRRGLYYVYCQVHFNEDHSIYIKLDLLLDGSLIFRCLQEFSATAASIRGPERKTCGVSGLLTLPSGSSLRVRTLPDVSLRVEHFLTYFGLFQVH
ncbi:tumor necrosis factor ligand superfamily member 12 [Spea bombifrons]|uniref:tumor necrosis factor ligand superfamily member 12 n=1 Tax=Spea bombifrons TaxID=233779 RepID=UPI0023497F36|nr:tumor necrosis factor ligand superfamily member 12 [Spea bombifrons]